MGGQSAPETSDWEIFADLPGKTRQGKNGKKEKRGGGEMEKKREGGKWKIENGTMEGGN